MALRVRIRVRHRASSKEVTTIALVNTGFETEVPQLLIPLKLAVELSLWPPPQHSTIVELGTAGGPVRKYLTPKALEVEVVEEDRVVGPIVCDAIISHVEEEVLINDKLSEELKIVILAAGSGKWKFVDDPPGLVRHSYSPQLWT